MAKKQKNKKAKAKKQFKQTIRSASQSDSHKGADVSRKEVRKATRKAKKAGVGDKFLQRNVLKITDQQGSKIRSGAQNLLGIGGGDKPKDKPPKSGKTIAELFGIGPENFEPAPLSTFMGPLQEDAGGNQIVPSGYYNDLAINPPDPAPAEPAAEPFDPMAAFQAMLDQIEADRVQRERDAQLRYQTELSNMAQAGQQADYRFGTKNNRRGGTFGFRRRGALGSQFMGPVNNALSISSRLFNPN